MVRFVSIVLLAIVYATIAPAVSAQQPGEAPRLLLNSGGAAQPLRSLRFSPDGTRLYAAGDHKCVHVWRIPAPPVPPSLESSLQWGISRANLGRIYTMDLASDGRKLVVGGYSIRNRGGDLTLFNLPNNQFDKPLPAADRPEDNLLGSGHVTRVNGTSFSLDGQRLATIGGEGDILIWSVTAGTIVERLAPRAAQPISDGSRQAPILYLANKTVIAPTPRLPLKNPPEWSLAAFETGKPVRTLLADDGRLVTLVRDTAGQKWASLHQLTPHVRVWDQAGQVSRSIRSSAANPQPSGLALGPGDLVLLAERRLPPNGAALDYFHQSAPTWLQMWDSGPAQPALIDEIQVSTSSTPINCAISPDGRWAATVAGDGEDIWLYPLLNARGERIARPLSGQQPILLRGRGLPFWKVAFEETASEKGEYRIGIGIERKQNLGFNDYGEVSREFDLVAGQYLPQVNAESRWRTPQTDAAGWEVLLSEGQDRGARLTLRNNGQNAGEIRLHPDNQGRCISHCWLPQAAGRNPALAIGMTGETGGIFVYELTNPAQPRLVRYYRDHQHWVTSLSVSRDGKYLASASRDQMIKIWSLAGLFDHPAKFSNACAWGAEFVPEGNQLVVRKVQPAGIVASRGLMAGDVIKAVNRKPVTNPQVMASYLNDRPIWETQGMLASGVRNGKNLVFDEFAITPAWEPLLSLLVDRNQEWALWTPRGYYNASAEGDKLFGWLVNRKRSEAPLFFRSDQLRQDMERPDVIRHILVTGNIDSALRAAGEEARIPDVNPVRDVAVNKLPELRIASPVNKSHFAAGQAVTIVARAEYPAALARNAFSPVAYVNSVPIASAPVIQLGPGPRQMTFSWQFEPTSEKNTVLIRLVQGADSASLRYVSDQIDFTAEIQPSLRKMYFFGLSGQEYLSSPLSFTHSDIESIREALEHHQGVYYDLKTRDDITHIRDAEISSETIVSYVTSLQKKLVDREKLAQEDLLVIAVSGHGVILPSLTDRNKTDYFFIQPHPEIKSLAADRVDVKRAIRQYAVPWETFEKLAELPCKKIFLLDTCHSGGASKGATRSLDGLQAFVIASASAHEKSYESPTFQHGIFTYCLLEGLKGSADGSASSTGAGSADANIDIFELAEYVRVNTAEKAFDRVARPQNPVILPGSNDPSFQFPLLRVQSMKTTAISP